MTLRRAVAAAVVATAVAAMLAYLRDPPWLGSIESGLRGWEIAADGTRFRWTDGHASFFVPAESTEVAIPLRATFDAPDDPPVLVTIAIDDRPADELVLRDPQWTTRRLRLPPPGSRSLRRIDIRVDRVRAGNRGVQLGQVRWRGSWRKVH